MISLDCANQLRRYKRRFEVLAMATGDAAKNRLRTKAKGRFTQWVERNEKTIAALSGVATALGLIFAAASSFFAWQQLELINRERKTPYRAIYYTAKLESYKETSSEMWQIIDNSSRVPKTSTNIDDYLKNGKKTKEFTTWLEATSTRLHRSLSIISSNRVVWPAIVQRQIIKVEFDIKHFTECVDSVLDDENSAFYCDDKWLERGGSRADDIPKAIKAMQENLKNDQETVAPGT